MTIADKHREVVLSRRQCSLAFLRRCCWRPTSNSAACAQMLLAGPHQHVNAEAPHRRVTQPTSARHGQPTIRRSTFVKRDSCATATLRRHTPISTLTLSIATTFSSGTARRSLTSLPAPLAAKGLLDPAQITHIGPAIRMTKRVGQGLPVPPDGRAIWKPRRPSSHVRHACRVDVASAKPRSHARFLLKGAI